MSEDIDDEIEPEPDKPRSAVEIAKRAIVLHCVISVPHDVSRSDMSKWLKDENLYEELSPWERRLFENEVNTQRDINAASWRVEGQVALLWSIMKIDRMDEPTAQCNTTLLVNAMPDLFSSTFEFIGSSSLRSAEEISDVYERIYDIHWSVGKAKRNNLELPIKYDRGVVQERHYALNWITGYCGQAWDEITTDT